MQNFRVTGAVTCKQEREKKRDKNEGEWTLCNGKVICNKAQGLADRQRAAKP